MSAPSLRVAQAARVDEVSADPFGTEYAAEIVLSILDRLLTIDSILDLGCGAGTWLLAGLKKPGREVLGVDCSVLDPEQLLIPATKVLRGSLECPIDLARQFDLVLCLHTADAIQPRYADEVVANCARHGNVVLFAAGIPGQSGAALVNPRPPEYWRGHFDQAGFEAVDLLRPKIWEDSQIPAAYRQNLLLFVDRRAAATLDCLRAEAARTPVPLHRAHPEFLNYPPLAPDAYDTERIAELEADWVAQREYSGRTLGQAWELISRLRGEVEVERFARQTAESAAASTSAASAILHKENSALRSSLSWRITAPLRAAGGIVLRLIRPS